MSKCGCADPIYNFKGDAFVNEKKQFGNKEFAPCRYDNKTESKKTFDFNENLFYLKIDEIFFLLN